MSVTTTGGMTVARNGPTFTSGHTIEVPITTTSQVTITMARDTIRFIGTTITAGHASQSPSDSKRAWNKAAALGLQRERISLMISSVVVPSASPSKFKITRWRRAAGAALSISAFAT